MEDGKVSRNEVIEELLRHYHKNNFKKIIKIIDKKLKLGPDDEIKIFEILVTIKNNPEKFDEIFPRLLNIAKTKPQHHAIIEAMVVCCATAKRENELIALLEESLDLSNINKEASLHLFQFSTKKFAFTSQIKAAYFLESVTKQSRYSQWAIMSILLDSKYGMAEQIDLKSVEVIQKSVKLLENVVYETTAPSITSTLLYCYVLANCKFWDKLLAFMMSDQAKTSIISASTKQVTRLDCYLYLNDHDNMIAFCETNVNKNNLYTLQPYLLDLYERLMENPDENQAKIAKIENIFYNTPSFVIITDKYFEINFEFAKYKILKSNLNEFLSKVHQYVFKNPNKMIFTNFLYHVKNIGKELMNYFDSKIHNNPYNSIPEIQTALSMYKVICGAYKDLKLDNKKQILLQKLELIKETEDVFNKFNHLVVIVEILFAIAEDNFRMNHFYVHYIIIVLINTFFENQRYPKAALMKLYSMKQICYIDYSQLSNLGFSDIKNILVETLPSDFEPAFILGLFKPAIESAEVIIKFQASTLYHIETSLLHAYQVASWKAIDDIVFFKYKFQMSYKATYAKILHDYYYLILDPLNFQKVKINLRTRYEIPEIDKVYTLEDAPRVYLNKTEYATVDEKLFLVDNSDDKILNVYQPPYREYSGSIKETLLQYKAFAIKFRKMLIEFTIEMSNMNPKNFNIEVLKKHASDCRNKLNSLNEEFQSMESLPKNIDFMMIDFPCQTAIWKSHDLITLVIEHYEDLEKIIDKKSLSNFIEFVAGCNNLKMFISEEVKTPSIETYPDIIKLINHIYDAFSFIFLQISYLKIYLNNSPSEYKYIREALIKKAKNMHSAMLSVIDDIALCINHLKAPETKVDLHDKYFEFLIDYLPETELTLVSNDVKKYYTHVIMNIQAIMTPIKSIKL